MGWTLRLVAAVAFTVVASCVCPAVLTVDLVTTDAFFAVHNKVSGGEVRLTHGGAWEVEGRLQCGTTAASGNTTVQRCPVVDGLGDTLRRLEAIRVLAWVCVPLGVLRLPLVAGMLWGISTRSLGAQWWVWPAVCLCTVGMLANGVLCVLFVKSVPLTDAHDWVVVPTTPSFLLTLLWNETVLLLLTVGDLLRSKQLLTGGCSLFYYLLVFLIGVVAGAPGIWRPFSSSRAAAPVLLFVGIFKVLAQLVAVFGPSTKAMRRLLCIPLVEFVVWTIWYSAAASPSPYITFFVDYSDGFVFPLMPMSTLALMTRACIMHIRASTGHEVLPIPDEWSTDNALRAIDVDAAHKQLLDQTPWNLYIDRLYEDLRMQAVREDNPRHAAPWFCQEAIKKLAVRGMCGRLLVALLAEMEGHQLGQLLQCLMQTDWGRLLLRSTTALSRRHPSVMNTDVLGAMDSSSALLHLHTCVRGGIWHIPFELMFPSPKLATRRRRTRRVSPAEFICFAYTGNTAGAIADCMTSFGFPFQAPVSWSCSFFDSFFDTLPLPEQVMLAGGADLPYVIPTTVVRIALFLAMCAAMVFLHVSTVETADGSTWMYIAFLVFASVCMLTVVVPEWLTARLSPFASRNPHVPPPEAVEMQYVPVAVPRERHDPPAFPEAGHATRPAALDTAPAWPAPQTGAAGTGRGAVQHPAMLPQFQPRVHPPAAECHPPHRWEMLHTRAPPQGVQRFAAHPPFGGPAGDGTGAASGGRVPLPAAECHPPHRWEVPHTRAPPLRVCRVPVDV